MRAISNSSVLIALSSIGQLELLRQRFPDGIEVPRAVWREVVETGQDRPGARAVCDATWIHQAGAPAGKMLDLLRADLDEGEAEAIALALGAGIRLILLDEKDARRIARRLGLTVLGTVGLLIWGRRMGFLTALRPCLDELTHQGKFRLSQEVIQNALRAVGE